jgi:hypothetical protein
LKDKKGKSKQRRRREGAGHAASSTFANQKQRVGLTLLFTIIFSLRILDTVRDPQFWAEDGTIFFRQNLCEGTAAIDKAYAGYYHLIPRLIANVAGWLSPSFAPAIYVGAALALTALVLYLVQSPRLPLPFAPMLALAVVLTPDSLETYGNLANLQWFLALGVIAIILSRPSPSKIRACLETFFVLLTGLTGPFVLMLLPVFAARLLLDWKNQIARDRTVALTAAAGIAALGQFYTMVHNPVATGISPNFQRMDISDVSLVAAAIFNHTFGMLLSGNSDNLSTLSWLGFIEIGVFLTIVLFSLRNSQLRFERLSLLYFGSVVLLASLYRFQDPLIKMVPLDNGTRYFLLPTVVASWLMISAWPEPRIGVLAKIPLVLVLLSALAGFERSPFINYHWPFWAKKLETGSKPKIPINPQSWFIQTDCSIPQ